MIVTPEGVVSEVATGCVLSKKVIFKTSKDSNENICVGFFFIEVEGLGPATLLKKRLQHKFFPADRVKFLITPFLQTEYFRDTTSVVLSHE